MSRNSLVTRFSQHLDQYFLTLTGNINNLCNFYGKSNKYRIFYGKVNEYYIFIGSNNKITIYNSKISLTSNNENSENPRKN